MWNMKYIGYINKELYILAYFVIFNTLLHNANTFWYRLRLFWGFFGIKNVGLNHPKFPGWVNWTSTSNTNMPSVARTLAQSFASNFHGHAASSCPKLSSAGHVDSTHTLVIWVLGGNQILGSSCFVFITLQWSLVDRHEAQRAWTLPWNVSWVTCCSVNSVSADVRSHKQYLLTLYWYLVLGLNKRIWWYAQNARIKLHKMKGY